MKTAPKIMLGFLLLFSLAACNLPAGAPSVAPTVDAGLVGTIAAQTLEAMLSPTPVFSATPLPSNTPNVTATTTPTITPTYALPSARFDGDTNCRQGPGTEYEVVTVIRSGQKAEVVGKAEKGNYWVIKNPNGDKTCWVAGDFAQTSGSLHLLPTVTAPPTPTPVPPKAPGWKTWNYSCSFASGGSNISVELAWSDNSNNEAGYNIYRNDELVASLGPDTISYVDTAFVATGKSVSYVVEAYNPNGASRSSRTSSLSCQ